MRDVERTREKFVNHELKAGDLQVFRVISQHPKCVNMPVKPIKSVVYCFKFIKQFIKCFSFLCVTGIIDNRFLTNQSMCSI